MPSRSWRRHPELLCKPVSGRIAHYDAMIEALQPLIGSVSFAWTFDRTVYRRRGLFPTAGSAPPWRPSVPSFRGDDPRRPHRGPSGAEHLVAGSAGILDPAKKQMCLPIREANANEETRSVFEYSAPWVFLGRAIAAAALGLPELAGDDFEESRGRFRLFSHHALEAQAILVESADVAVTYRLNEPSYRQVAGIGRRGSVAPGWWGAPQWALSTNLLATEPGPRREVGRGDGYSGELFASWERVSLAQRALGRRYACAVPGRYANRMGADPSGLSRRPQIAAWGGDLSRRVGASASGRRSLPR